ncbi:uncharacterized protein LOC117179768 [Belonocnema kinseyi]|uniref:uncharacterized protein LOC117179768 n=1 Tax=Belonocnema kinseyi TaxID=2817044 RepID=UPI00143CD972|nr:uncharacterized protein LOC117179768 [Belonocnema kinseyi]
MESEERIESQITHRKGKEKPVFEDVNAELTEKTSAENKENENTSTTKDEEKEEPPKLRPQEDFTTWGTIKYRFYWFRFYHFYYADQLDRYMAAGCLWIMRMYFKLMGLADAGPEVDD